MRADLLAAQASIDWAESNLPAFRNRLKAWLDDNIDIVITDEPPPATHNVVVAREKGLLPLDFSVEAGAYINAIRSSLDILACAIGKRDMVLDSDDLYFPMADSAEDLAAGNYKGFKLVKQLSADNRLIIERFKPYRGGNEHLWACHKLDVVRKHKRLLETYVRPAHSSVTGWRLREDWAPVATGFMDAGNGETVIGLLRKGAQKPKIRYTARVCFNEAAAMPGVRVDTAIKGFAMAASTVISAFD